MWQEHQLRSQLAEQQQHSNYSRSVARQVGRRVCRPLLASYYRSIVNAHATAINPICMDVVVKGIYSQRRLTVASPGDSLQCTSGTLCRTKSRLLVIRQKCYRSAQYISSWQPS